jgi:alpha-tubulin suppressor-like RCC1 family protein
VKCWGANYSGALGDGTTSRHFAPVDVLGLSSGVRAVSVGYDSACALLSTGAVRCWGSNANGKLGDGSGIDRLTPVDVVGLGGGVAAISSGVLSSCAVMSAGGVKCWGFHYGYTPVEVPGLSTGVKAIATGFPSCVITKVGGVECWGVEQGWTPTDVPGLGSGVKAIATAGGTACALMVAGGVKCWGSNEFGQLGNGTMRDSPRPVNVIGLGRGVAAIGVGGFHNCAVTRVGTARCWGLNGAGELGDGTTRRRLRPVEVLGLGPPAARCTVPSVVGRRLMKASAIIVHAHCRVGAIVRIASSRSRNVVVSQSPRPGTRLKAGARVNLRVSRGA